MSEKKKRLTADEIKAMVKDEHKAEYEAHYTAALRLAGRIQHKLYQGKFDIDPQDHSKISVSVWGFMTDGLSKTAVREALNDTFAGSGLSIEGWNTGEGFGLTVIFGGLL